MISEDGKSKGRNARTGAEASVEALAAGGVEVCFTNPGTSEMHFVAALDRLGLIKPVLGLAEGVVSGAADGYGRVKGKPAMTLLHLGPGMANAIANFHNASRGKTPIVNIVGDHARDHLAFDAPLTSDIESLARPFSKFYRSVAHPDHMARDSLDALAAANALPGGVATLVIPADCAWTTTEAVADAQSQTDEAQPDADMIKQVVTAIQGGSGTALLLDSTALNQTSLAHALAIQQATGARILGPTFLPQTWRGQGMFQPERIPYFGEMARPMLAGLEKLILVGAEAPVPFFGYPDKPSKLLGENTEVMDLFAAHVEPAAIVAAIADEMDVKPAIAEVANITLPTPHDGPLGPPDIGGSIARHLPDNAIMVDESVTAGVAIEPLTLAARPHEWIEQNGGAIGWGLAAAVGAAVAAPDRKVVAIEADGSAMYSIQALWTAAREGLDILAVILANRSYFILNVEFSRVGAGAPGEYARDMLNIDRPTLDFVGLARGMGVEAAAATTAREFDDLFQSFIGKKGVRLIEAQIAGFG